VSEAETRNSIIDKTRLKKDKHIPEKKNQAVARNPQQGGQLFTLVTMQRSVLLVALPLAVLLLLLPPVLPYFFINPDSPITLGFILNMPISLALPTLVDTSRSLKEDVLFTSPDLTSPNQLAWEPAYEQPLANLAGYFSYLEAASVECQERLICEMAASPAKFSPLSELVLKELKQKQGPLKPSQDSLFWRYLASSATGYAYGADACPLYYDACPIAAERQVNMAVLKVWQFLESKVGLKLY